MTHEDDPLADLPWPEPAAPSAATTDSIKRNIKGQLAPARGMSVLARLTLSFVVSAVGCIAVVWVLGNNRTEDTMRAALLGAAGWGIVLASVLVVGLARPPGRRAAKLWRLAVAVLVPVVFVGVLAFSGTYAEPLESYFADGHGESAVTCGLHALFAGTLAAAVLMFVWRGTDPLSPGISGALAGLSGGMVGAVAMDFTCPTGEIWHLILSHGLVVAVLAGVGFVAGRRWLAP